MKYSFLHHARRVDLTDTAQPTGRYGSNLTHFADRLRAHRLIDHLERDLPAALPFDTLNRASHHAQSNHIFAQIGSPLKERFHQPKRGFRGMLGIRLIIRLVEQTRNQRIWRIERGGGGALRSKKAR